MADLRIKSDLYANAFLPRNRIRDGQVLTRDVSICQMWLEGEE